MDQTLYKEAAIALVDFLSLALKHLSTTMPDRKLKDKLVQLSEDIKRVEEARDIAGLKGKYRRVLLDAEAATVKQKKTEPKERDIPLASDVSPPVRREEVDMGLLETPELLEAYVEIIIKFLKGLKSGAVRETIGDRIDSLIERLPRLKRLDEVREFERTANEAITSKAFIEEKTFALNQEVLETILEGLLLWVDKNSILERRIEKAGDPQVRASDPWILKDLAASLKSFFFSKRQEMFVLAGERERLKSIMVSLVHTIQEVAEKNQIFMENVDQYATALEQSEDIQEIEKIKSGIILEVGNLRKKTEGQEEEINSIKSKLLSARAAIRSLEEELEKAKEESLRDPLTGLLSRAALEDKLEDLLNRSRESKEPVGLLLCDLDKFRSVIVKHGKAVGDGMLKVLADDLREELGQGDCLARFAGNSFAMALPQIESIRLRDMAEKIRETIRNHEFVLKSERIFVTASVAVVRSTPEDTPESVVNRLLGLMDEIKKHGGNRCAFGPLEA